MRKVTAKMTCLLAAGFFFSLFASLLLEITGRRDGMGWDGEGIEI